jgi:endonuclease YncB( thermonuclease family)
MTFLIRCLLVALLVPWPARADITGRPTVLDGDTLQIGAQRIRLHGIDAPERRQTCAVRGELWGCGAEATRALASRIGNGDVECAATDTDRYGRTVAVCRSGGIDLNAWMVAEGWALAFRRYALDYVQQEVAAQDARRGIWRGEFVAPWEWRRGKRLASTGEDATRPRTECRIKGNISRSSERIYHVPGGRYYARTRIEPAKGERWFCSEQEALSAGWRPAR